jgi:hypothetical protein
LPLLSPFCVNRVLFSFDAIGVVMVVTDNILFSYLFMRVRVLFREWVCEDISQIVLV